MRSKGHIPPPRRSNTSTETMLNFSMSITSPQTQNCLISKPCFTFWKTMKWWSRWSLRVEVRRWDTCPEPTESHLIGCFPESTWTQQIQIKYDDTRNRLADMVTKGNFTRDEWNHFLRLTLCVFSKKKLFWSNFKTINKSKITAKRQQDGKLGEQERVVAKSKPTISVVSKIATRLPMLNSSASNGPGTLKSTVRIQTVPVRWDLLPKVWMTTQHRVLKWGIRVKTFILRFGNQLRKNDKQTQWNKVDPSQFPIIQW